MCAGSHLSAQSSFGCKAMHGIICDTLHCPDPVKMGVVSPWKLSMCVLHKWAGFTAQPVIPHLQSCSSAGPWAAARAQCALGCCRKVTSLFLWLWFCSCEIWSRVLLVWGTLELDDRPLGKRNHVYDTAYKWELTWLMFHGIVTERAMQILFGAMWSLFFFSNIWMFFSHPGLLPLTAKLTTCH